MAKFFVPYSGDEPVPVDIKGHKLVLVSQSKLDVENELQSLKAEYAREFNFDDLGHDIVLSGIAQKVGTGIVMTPKGTKISQVLFSLQKTLPWVN